MNPWLSKIITNTTIFQFQDSEITATTSGNNQLILCDSIGRIHIVSRSCQKITTVKGYEIRITLAQQLRNSPILVTIGVIKIL